ncbi:MAG: hypothetical protein EBS77_07345 [Gammaproteobacteria bacterium]|nr:hypothetical protein [Gammaproteobacteria bacterium]
MFSETLPERLNAVRFVDAGDRLAGALEPAHYKRFAEIATLMPGGTVELQGARDAFGPRVITGSLRCEAELTCQRCLQPVVVPLVGTLRWGLVRDENAAAQLDREYDPVVLDDGDVWVRQVIEDELLLLVPIMPMHDMCDIGWTSDPEPDVAPERESPFGVLRALKTEQGPKGE